MFSAVSAIKNAPYKRSNSENKNQDHQSSISKATVEDFLNKFTKFDQTSNFSEKKIDSQTSIIGGRDSRKTFKDSKER